MDKNYYRNKYKKLRADLSSSEIEDLSLKIANNCLLLDIWNLTYFHIYLPISEKKEVNTEYLLHILQGKDKSVVISKSNFETGELRHYLLQENTRIQKSSYGIPEPLSGIEIDPIDLEVVFVPLLAFDKKGNRIGYGKGFYDRFLAQCSSKTIFIGLSFFPPEDKIIHEIIDIPLHFCVTPQKSYTF